MQLAVCPFCPPAVLDETLMETPDARVLWSKDRTLLIVPKVHRSTPFELTATEWAQIQQLLQDARSLIEEEPAGWNVGWNIGKVGGQEIEHVHCHLIPRYADEPYAGRGLRWWFKQPENRRPGWPAVRP
jgi:diadenosine tetraphosphate (Ap4A) HIT family hydrolase